MTLQFLSKMVSVVYSDENDIELLRPSFVNSIAILANSLDAALNSLTVKFLNSISIQFFLFAYIYIIQSNGGKSKWIGIKKISPPSVFFFFWHRVGFCVYPTKAYRKSFRLSSAFIALMFLTHTCRTRSADTLNIADNSL